MKKRQMIIVKDTETKAFLCIPVDSISCVKENPKKHTAIIIFDDAKFQWTINCLDLFESIMRILSAE